jgi:MFS family permease
MGPGVWYQSRVRCPARRWLIVAALFAVTYGAASLLAAYGVFLPVIAEAFGWSRGAIATALSLNLVVGGVAGFGAGALADRHGPRLLLVVTTLLATAAFALVATVTALWQLYLFVGVAGGLGMSSFYLLSTSTVLRWFDDRRALAVALVLIGYHVGFITAGPLAPGSSPRSAGGRHMPRWRRARASSRCWPPSPCGCPRPGTCSGPATPRRGPPP